MSGLAAGFGDDLRAAVLDKIERAAREQLAPEVQEQAHSILQAYGSRNDYDVQPLIDAGDHEVVRERDRILVRWGWPEPAIYFERGTVAHEVRARGDGALRFRWGDPPQWVRAEFERDGDAWIVYLPSVNVEGLPESRFIRDALHWLRRHLT
jgi:hypothetical protein